ncbi:MAG: hypothetical protein L0177_01005 [Chloroflexi bacterium]|nr:hypothetical protein [Chloroflexota bacterium]
MGVTAVQHAGVTQQIHDFRGLVDVRGVIGQGGLEDLIALAVQLPAVRPVDVDRLEAQKVIGEKHADGAALDGPEALLSALLVIGQEEFEPSLPALRFREHMRGTGDDFLARQRRLRPQQLEHKHVRQVREGEGKWEFAAPIEKAVYPPPQRRAALVRMRRSAEVGNPRGQRPEQRRHADAIAPQQCIQAQMPGLGVVQMQVKAQMQQLRGTDPEVRQHGLARGLVLQ